MSPTDDKLWVLPSWHLKCICLSTPITTSVPSKTERSLRSCCYTNLLQSHLSFWLHMYTGLDLSPEGPCEQESMARQHASENRPTPLACYVIARDISTNQLYHHPSLLSLDSVTHSDMCPTVQKSGNCHSVEELQRKEKMLQQQQPTVTAGTRASCQMSQFSHSLSFKQEHINYSIN